MKLFRPRFLLILGLALSVPALFGAGRIREIAPGGPAPDVSAKAVVIMDDATGTILYAKNPDEPIPPASLTKLVTLDVVYDELAAGRLSRSQLVTIDPRDCSPIIPLGSSIMYLRPGMHVSILDLMQGTAVVSGCDAAFALARAVSGSSEAFAKLMNADVQAKGLTALHFVEPSGLSEKNMVTARQFADFCRSYLRDHPESIAELHSLHYIDFPRPEHATKDFIPKGRTLQFNRNNLVLDYPGCDGLKTGYIVESGFNLAATAERDGTRFIIVTLGGSGSSSSGGGSIRASDGAKLLDWSFANWKTETPRVPDIPAIRAWYGAKARVALAPSAALAVTLPNAELGDLSVRAEIDASVVAPVSKGEKLGEVIYTSGSTVVRRVDLVASSDVARGNIFVLIHDALERFFRSIFAPRSQV
ncbi:MAG TPA: D-alanyl-D-alanine carboxypeptidase family protein [Rectinemataceae bacterium]|nr:D-alanyl-D-alanine carboxypeptidase family protein [Rectinemataceae bacterium]